MRSRTVLLALLALPAAASAQSAPDHSIGLGVGILSSLTVRVPVRLGHSWRVEPAFSVDYGDAEQVIYQNGQPSTTTSTAFHFWTVALNVSRRFRVDEGLDFYFGPRVALTRSSGSEDFPASVGGGHIRSHHSDVDAGAVAGAEVTLRRRFSLGGEVGAVYRSLGTTKVDQPLPTGVILGVTSGGHRVFTYGDVVIRWYFGHPRS